MTLARAGRAVALLLLAVAAAATPAGAVPAAGQTVDGIRCERMEGSAFHIHQHLAIFDHGKPVPIPSDVGRPLIAACFYWIHTHTPDGIIHIESPAVRAFTLGQFFAVWGEPLSRTRADGARVRPHERMTVWVNGVRYAGDPAKIELAQHSDIVIQLGPPAKRPAPFVDWGPN